MTLDEFVKRVDDTTIMYIGSRSCFLFIGNKARYEELIDTIYEKTLTELKFRLRFSKAKKQKQILENRLKTIKPFRDRDVLDYYAKERECGLGIQIEGGENGKYWFLHEFEKVYGKGE